MADIAIIGGGISGCAAAHALARAGHAVVLLEARRLAAMASGWTLAGVRQSGRDPAELPLAQAAVERWGGLAAELGEDVGYRRDGNLRLARTPEEVERIRTMVDEQRARGLDLAFLPDNAAVRAVAPAISPHVLAASFCPSDGHAEPVRAVHAFAAAARAAGAELREGVLATAVRVASGRVQGVETADGFVPAGVVVVAAGVHAPELLAPLGLDLPVEAQLVTVVLSEPIAPVFAQVFGVANADCAGRQQIDGRLRYTNGIGPWPAGVSGWTEEALRPEAPVVDGLRRLVSGVLPVAAEVPVARCWGGLIDLTPDALPVIDGDTGVDGLVVAAGFSGHGFCLGPVTGAIIGDLATGRTPRHALDAFRLARFAGKRPSRPRAELTLHG